MGKIPVQIDSSIEGSAPKLTATSNRNLTCVQIHRMRKELALWQARFHVYVDSGIEAIKCMAKSKHSPFLTEEIAPEDVRDKAPLSIEWSNSELTAEQVEVAFRKIEQRTDSGIRLAIIVAKMAFEVTSESGKAEVRKQLPTI